MPPSSRVRHKGKRQVQWGGAQGGQAARTDGSPRYSRRNIAVAISSIPGNLIVLQWIIIACQLNLACHVVNMDLQNVHKYYYGLVWNKDLPEQKKNINELSASINFGLGGT